MKVLFLSNKWLNSCTAASGYVESNLQTASLLVHWWGPYIYCAIISHNAVSPWFVKDKQSVTPSHGSSLSHVNHTQLADAKPEVLWNNAQQLLFILNIFYEINKENLTYKAIFPQNQSILFHLFSLIYQFTSPKPAWKKTFYFGAAFVQPFHTIYFKNAIILVNKTSQKGQHPNLSSSWDHLGEATGCKLESATHGCLPGSGCSQIEYEGTAQFGRISPEQSPSHLYTQTHTHTQTHTRQLS